MTIPPLLEDLTDRETQCLQLAASGLINKEIGKKLYIHENTVKSHLRRAFLKMQVHDRTLAVIRALQLGLIEVEGLSTEQNYKVVPVQMQPYGEPVPIADVEYQYVR